MLNDNPILYLLNEKFETVSVIDTYKSLIWSRRYLECGDFELYLDANEQNLTMFDEDMYLEKDDNILMIVENIEVITDLEDGNSIKVSGRDLKSLLDRRIIWNHTVLKDNYEKCIEKILNDNIISPSIENRKIENFIIEKSKTLISEEVLELQYFGDNLLKVIQGICNKYDIGFDIKPDYSNGGFIFYFINGIDYSFKQEINPWVIFSNNFDNLLNSNYIKSSKIKKTAVLVGGEGEGHNKKTVEVLDKNGGGKGVKRKEIYTDASSISTNIDGSTISDYDYNKQLIEKGKETLKENSIEESFEAEINYNEQFIFGRDYTIGDIVQIVNELGRESRVRVTEMVESYDENGFILTPTFISIEGDDEQ